MFSSHLSLSNNASLQEEKNGSKQVLTGFIKILLNVDLAILTHRYMAFSNQILRYYEKSHNEITFVVKKLFSSDFFIKDSWWIQNRSIHLTIRLSGYWGPVENLTSKSINNGHIVICGIVQKVFDAQELLWSGSEKTFSNPIEISVQTVQLLLTKGVLSLIRPTGNNWSSNQKIFLILTDDLVNQFSRGDKILSIGRLRASPPKYLQSALSSKKSRYWFDVNNCQHLHYPTTNNLLPPKEKVESAAELFPWKTTRYLADQLTSGIFPEGHGRAASVPLILSLLSGTQARPAGLTEKRNQLHVLIVSDCILVQRLVERGISLHEDTVKYNGMPKCDKDWMFISGGLLYIKHNGPLSDKSMCSLQKVLKERRATVWLLVAPQPLKPGKTASKQVKQLSDSFDIVVSSTERKSASSNLDAKFACFVLDGYNSSVKPLSFDDFSFRRALQIRMGEDARLLIKEYFMAARSKAQYTFSDLETVARLARAHARLSLRQTVLAPDVLVAILVMEETQCRRKWKGSAFGFQALPNLDLNVDKTYDGSCASEQFRSYCRQLRRFVNTF